MKRGRSHWRVALVVLVITTLACNAAAATPSDDSSSQPDNPDQSNTSEQAGDPAQPTDPPAQARRGVVIVAYRVEGDGPAAVVYVGDPDADPLNLPPGTYIIQAVDAAKPTEVLTSAPKTVPSGEPLPVGDALKDAAAIDDGAKAAALGDVAKFMMSAEGAKLSALRAFSNDYTTELFTAEAPPGNDLIAAMFADYAAAGQDAPAAITALDVLTPVSTNTAAPAGHARPVSDTWWDDIKESFEGFYGEVSASDARAVERIAAIGATLTPEEKQAAFDGVPEGLRGDALSFDEMVKMMQNGQIAYAANQIHVSLANDPAYAAAAQQAGARPIDVGYAEGAVLVTKGAEFEAEVVKAVLGEVFPGDFDRGIELADQINEWIEYANDVYQNPLGQAEGWARDEFEGLMAERIKESLEACCADSLTEEQREEIANALGGAVTDQIPTIAQGTTPTPSAPDEGGGQPPASGAGAGESGGGSSGGEPQPTATPANVVVTVSGNFDEAVSVGTFGLSTRIVLVADFGAGVISGQLSGAGIEPTEVECREDNGNGPLIESASWEIGHTYSASFVVNFDPATGAFTAPLVIDGNADWTQTTRYSDDRCMQLNVGTYSEGWTGQGTVSGTVLPTGEVTLTTDWGSGNRTVGGTFRGAGRVEVQ
jgi:hypothetical protein